MTMTETRTMWKGRSNNEQNANKNICVLAIAKALHVENETRYLHRIADLVVALRKRYTVRSRGSKVIGKTVGKIRGMLSKMADEVNAVGFVARVDGHVLLLNTSGQTVVDTSPRKRDCRKIRKFYVIY